MDECSVANSSSSSSTSNSTKISDSGKHKCEVDKLVLLFPGRWNLVTSKALRCWLLIKDSQPWPDLPWDCWPISFSRSTAVRNDSRWHWFENHSASCTGWSTRRKASGSWIKSADDIAETFLPWIIYDTITVVPIRRKPATILPPHHVNITSAIVFYSLHPHRLLLPLLATPPTLCNKVWLTLPPENLCQLRQDQTGSHPQK